MNTPKDDIDSKLLENDENTAKAIHEFDGTQIDEAKNFLKNKELGESYTQGKKTVAEERQNKSVALLNVLKERDELKAVQKDQEEEQKFLEIEKDVLASLPEPKQQKITTMSSWLKNNYGERYKTSYKQAIMKLHNKEVVIGSDSVQFIYAHKELYKQELQLNKTEDGDIFDYKYEDFDGKDIARREIKQKVLDKDSKYYHYIQEAQEKLKQEGKYIATEENTFAPILNGFDGELDQKIKAVQFLTEFVGRGIISLEKDENDCRRFLRFTRSKGNTSVYDNNTPRNKGSLFVVKDC